jgi:hypothetical protein
VSVGDAQIKDLNFFEKRARTQEANHLVEFQATQQARAWLSSMASRVDSKPALFGEVHNRAVVLRCRL